MHRRAKQIAAAPLKITFAIMLVICSPVILYHLAAGEIGNRIRRRWPHNPRAQALGCWFSWGATGVGIAVLVVVLLIAISRVPREAW